MTITHIKNFQQIFNANGTFNVPKGVFSVYLEMVGGGGAGMGGGASSPPDSGGNGVNSAFGSVIAKGGLGGDKILVDGLQFSDLSSFASGGGFTPLSGDSQHGGNSQSFVGGNGGAFGVGSGGGASFFGNGGNGGAFQNNGVNGGIGGGGGGGGGDGAFGGGFGGQSGHFFSGWIMVTPSAAISVVRGAGGVAGGGFNNAGDGGVGGVGRIIVNWISIG